MSRATFVVLALLLASTRAQAQPLCLKAECLIKTGETVDAAIGRAQRKQRFGALALVLGVLHTGLAIGSWIYLRNVPPTDDFDVAMQRGTLALSMQVTNTIGAAAAFATAMPLLIRGSIFSSRLKSGDFKSY